MAGDWIKMRGELFSHPRFLSLCSALIYDESRRGMLVYVCGRESLGIGVMPPSPLSVTEKALRAVTESALRDVTMSALLRVWCAVNSHCKVENGDAVMQPMALVDLDRIAGFDDFGLALEDVGWVREPKRNRLVFPNFLEYNEPACLRAPAKSNAERQAEFRKRKQAADPVTKSNESNDREEKSREEKKTQEEANASCPEPAKPPASGPQVMAFPCVGTRSQSREWPLTAEKLTEYRESFPGFDVLAELRKARQWLLDNPAKRKTFAGTPRFLGSWLGRTQDRGAQPGGDRVGTGPGSDVGRRGRPSAPAGKYADLDTGSWTPDAAGAAGPELFGAAGHPPDAGGG